MNCVILMGRLTADPVVRYNQQGECAAGHYTIAVDRWRKSEDGTRADFIQCVVFGKSAEFVEKWFKKGTKIVVRGRLQQNNYTKQTGEKVFGYQVVVDEHDFAERSTGNSIDDASEYLAEQPIQQEPVKSQPVQQQPVRQQAQQAPRQYRQTHPQQRQPQPQPMYNDGFMTIPEGYEDDGLPFN